MYAGVNALEMKEKTVTKWEYKDWQASAYGWCTSCDSSYSGRLDEEARNKKPLGAVVGFNVPVSPSISATGEWRFINQSSLYLGLKKSF